MTTMVCVAVAGEPVIGVIHSPFSGQTAWAWVGQSMSEYLGELVKLPRLDAAEPVITISRSHTAAAKDVARAAFGDNVNVLTAAGAGYKVLQVVANNATAYLHTSFIKKWDICAGHAILRALGGAMTTLNDEPISYGPSESEVNKDGLLATLADHEKYMERLSKYRSAQNGKLR